LTAAAAHGSFFRAGRERRRRNQPSRGEEASPRHQEDFAERREIKSSNSQDGRYWTRTSDLHDVNVAL
jgi:hypothetical protein